MNFTVICPNCGSRLQLFDSQIKKKKGTLRCVRCGSRIPYDLTQPRPVRTGFWPETEVPFKPGAQKKFLSIAKARQKNPDFQLRPLAERPPEDRPAPAPSAASRVPPAFDRSQNAFQKFDLKTGQIIGSAAPAAKSAPRPQPASKAVPHPQPAPETAAQAPRSRNIPRVPADRSRPARRSGTPKHPISREAVRAARPAAARPVRAPGVLSRLCSFFLRLFKK